MSEKELSYKHRQFINELFLCNMNATQAYINVYSPKSNASARASASALLTNINILREIERRFDEIKMSANEVIFRYSDIARADIGDFMDIESMTAVINLKKAKDAGKTHLIKKIKQRTTYTTHKDGSESEDHWIELELHDPMKALDKLGSYLKLFTDRVEIVNPLDEIVYLLERGDISPREVEQDFGDSLARSLFERAGIAIDDAE